MAKKNENYLDYIPKHNTRFSYCEKENKRIEVKVKNRGLFNRIAQIVFRRPRYSYIELDDFGSFIWKQINGERTIYDIGIVVKEQFGKEVEPLFDRLTKYFHVLRSNCFIVYINKNKKL